MSTEDRPRPSVKAPRRTTWARISRATADGVNRLVEVVSAIFMPLLGVLAGTGLLKALLSLAYQLGWLVPGDDTATILSATADAFFYALPVMLAYTTARLFGAHVLTALTLGFALISPELVALLGADVPVTFIGLPVPGISYVSSVIPIILAVWVLSRVERVLNAWIPALLRDFLVPPLALLVMVPLTLVVIGPAASAAGGWLGAPLLWLFHADPPASAVLAGAIFGGGQQFIQVFGLHWGFVPVMIQEIADNGFSLLLGPLFAAAMGQASASLAVSVRTRSTVLRGKALSAAIAGFVAGVTEPSLYGVNVPLRRPFLAGCIGGAVGGAVVAAGGVSATVFVFPGLFSLPAFLSHGSLVALAVGILLSIVIAFGLTLALGFVDPERSDDS